MKLPLLTTFFLASALHAQTASFTPIGSACSAPGEPTPAIGAVGLPQIGTSFDVTYSGPNRAMSSAQQSVQPFLLTGFNLYPSPIVVPLALFFAQPPGCTVYVQTDFVLNTPLDASGRAFIPSVTLRVPNDPRLLGASWFHQWFALYTQCGFAGCNPMWVITSDAAIVSVGL